MPLVVATTSGTVNGKGFRVCRRPRAFFLQSLHRTAHLVASTTFVNKLVICLSKALKLPSRCLMNALIRFSSSLTRASARLELMLYNAVSKSRSPSLEVPCPKPAT